MAQPFNSRQGRDENFITVPTMGLVTNAPVGGYPPEACTGLVNLEPNYAGQLQSRKGSDIVYFSGVEFDNNTGAMYLECLPLESGWYFVVMRQVYNLYLYLYNPKLRTMYKVKEWLSVWPPECVNTKLSSAVLGNLIVLSCTKMVPIVVKAEEVFFVPDSTSYAVPDTEGRWRYSAPWLLFEDGTCEQASVSWAANVATVTIPEAQLQKRCWLVAGTIHWMCGGKRYYGNQLYRRTRRFMSTESDRTVATPESLLTNQVVRRQNYYPLVLAGVKPQALWTLGDTEEDIRGQWLFYGWAGQSYGYFENPTGIAVQGPESVTFGALDASMSAWGEVRFYRLVEINASVPDLVVLVQDNEDAPLEQFFCSDSVLGGTPAQALKVYTPFTDPNTYALGNKTTTVYPFIAFNLSLRQLNKEAVAYILVKPDALSSDYYWPNPHLMEYSPHKDFTLYPAPGSSSYGGKGVGPGAVSTYNNRLVLSSYALYPGVVNVSRTIARGASPVALDFYGEEYGSERLPTDPFILDIDLEQGQKVTGVGQFLQNLIVCTDQSLWRVHGGQGQNVTPLSIVVDRQYSSGCHNARAVVSADDGFYFYGKSGIYRLFLRDQTYQVENLSLPIWNLLPRNSNSSESSLLYNSWENTVYAHVDRARIYAYYSEHQMWSRVAYGKNTDYFYGAVSVEDHLLFPDKSTHYYIVGTETKAGHYCDSYRELTTVEGQTVYDTGLEFLRVEVGGTYTEELLNFHLVPSSVDDISTNGTISKTKVPPTLTMSLGGSKRLGDILPVMVFLDGELLNYGTDFTSYSGEDGRYFINFNEVPPPGATLGVGYSYPQYLESAPLVRNTLLRSKQTRVAALLAGTASGARVAAAVQLGGFSRSFQDTSTVRTTEIGFPLDGGLKQVSASINVEGVAPYILLYQDFRPSGFIIDSYHIFAETNERRSAGGL